MGRNLTCLVGLLLPLLGDGCIPHPQAEGSEILSYLRMNPNIVVARYHPGAMQFQDATCREGYSRSLHWGLPLFPFLSSNPCLARASVLGQNLTRELALQDPTPLVQQHFLHQLTSKVSLDNVTVLQTVELERPKLIGSSLVIDFKTFESSFQVWAVKYDSPNNAPFHFWFGVRTSATEGQEGKKLWAEACFYRTNERGEGPYRLEELLSDGGAKVKQIIEHAANECGKELAAKILGEGEPIPKK